MPSLTTTIAAYPKPDFVPIPDRFRARLAAALAPIDGPRLIAALDCGLGLLGCELARRKLRNRYAAARRL